MQQLLTTESGGAWKAPRRDPSRLMRLFEFLKRSHGASLKSDRNFPAPWLAPTRADANDWTTPGLAA